MRLRLRSVVLAVAGLSAAAAVLAMGAPAYADDPPAPPGTPTATSYAGTSTVGPLFSGPVTGRHGCTASVIASPSQDLVLTAAHCVSGTAAGLQFAPGFNNGATPYGVWTVIGAYVSPAWEQGQDTQHDYAILKVAPQTINGHRTTLQRVTGGNVLAVAPPSGARVTDIAYNGGVGGQAIRCTVPVYYTDGYPGFNCHGYVGGSSGSPWLLSVGSRSLPVVVGLIGGLHQGGCYEYTSYSSAFRPDIYRVLLRAVLGRSPDTVPEAGSDGC